MTEITYNDHLLDGVRRLHFIGIGGSGMFPLVQILHAKGYQITGSDVLEGSLIDAERSLGIQVAIGHKPENISGADVIVYSAAIHPDNCELSAARQAGIPCIERSVLLGYVSRLYAHSVCIAGTHGKTTTTSLVTTLLELGGRDPSAVIGGKLPLIHGYGKAGGGDTIAVEACEYSETFLQLTPTLGVILNIDNDHLEYFGSMENLKKAFRRFADLCQAVCYNLDDLNTAEALDGLECEVMTYGVEDPTADYRAVNITEHRPGFFAFDVLERGKPYAHLEMGVPGRHNVYNALAMCAVCSRLGMQPADAVRAAREFRGAGRRFEIKGEVNGALVVDDYAHHPTELRATLSTAKSMGYKRVIAVHQPFTYSRTRMLMKDFAEVLRLADLVVLEPILGSREVDDGSVKSEDLAACLPDCRVVRDHADCAALIKKIARPGDLIVCMSCGDLYKAADLMVSG